MRIAMLSDTEKIGGAAVAASRLADGLAQCGHEVFRIVFEAAPETQHSWKTVPLTAQLSLSMRAASRLLGSEWREGRLHSDAERQLEAQLSEIKPDIINIHNLHGALHHWTIDLC